MLIARHELEIHRIIIEKAFEPQSLKFDGVDFRQAGTLTVSAIAELVGEDVRIRGSLKTRIEAECARCLQPVALPVEHDFDLTYRPVGSIAREEEMQLPEGELDIGFYHGEGIELGDVLAEQVILALPMTVICREDCLGLCPTCGADRNTGVCPCPAPQSGSPFAVLRGE